jgi:hypothetical protein
MLSYVLPEQPGRQLDRLTKVLRMAIDDLCVDSRHDVLTPRSGTAPIEVSSGRRKIYRRSRRGKPAAQPCHHMAAAIQISHRHSPGWAYYQRKLAEGKTPKEALRSLKRRLSDQATPGPVTTL